MARMFPSSNMMDAQVRIKVVDALNPILATLTDLHAQVKHAHWNVKSPQFYSLHKLFDELAESIPDDADTVAERIGALGGYARGTIQMACSDTKIGNLPEPLVDGVGLVRDLIDKFAAAENLLRTSSEMIDKMGDCVSANMLQDMAHRLGKGLYFLEAHIQN